MIITLREERNLLQRFIIIARSRSELDLEECIGEFEFGVVPRSLFSADGLLFNGSREKYKVSNTIINDVQVIGAEKELQNISNITSETNNSFSQYKVILVDGMALVNALQKIIAQN